MHGYQNDGHTIFPSPISTAASFNGTLAFLIGRVIGTEARVTGTHEIWSPVCGLAREPRWGRSNEEFGEDVHLAATMVGQQVLGMSDSKNYSSTTAVAPLLKHLWVYSIGEGGLNARPAHAGRREVLSEFAEVFRSGVQHGALGAMSSYNEVDGVPTTVDPWVLNETLRGAWGFDGYVTADFGAVRKLEIGEGKHAVAENASEAVRQFLAAGGNMQGYDYPQAIYQAIIIELVASGRLPQATLDARAADVLRVKARLGLLDAPYVDETLAAAYSDTPAHRRLAREAADQTMTLLKNEGSALPLEASSLASIAVVGPNADAPRCGDYAAAGKCGGGTVNNRNVVSILAGLKAELAGTGVALRHVPGTAIFDADHGAYFEAIQPHHFGAAGLNGTYYAALDLSGPPLVRRAEPSLNMHWFNYGPCGVPYGALGGPTDGCAGVPQPVTATFSARLDGTITSDATAGTAFQLHLHGGSAVPGTPTDPQGRAQCGGRLWLDGALLIDSWTNCTDAASASVRLTAGEAHAMRVEVWIRDGVGTHPEFSLQWDQTDRALAGIDAAARAAAAADATVAVVGGYQQSSGEGTDRAELSLPGTEQLRLVKAAHAAAMAAGKVFVVVFVSGKPVAEPWIATHVSAILHAWQAGQAQGSAVARTLLGRYNPAGRAAVTTPVSASTLPAYYSHKSSASRAGWCDVNGSAILWPFGHGLSYSTFEYSALSIANANANADADADAVADADADAVMSKTLTLSIGKTGRVAVSCVVTNTGARDGDEVVQLYVRDVVASVTTPALALKGFHRVQIRSGEAVTVRLVIDVAEQLKLLDRTMTWRVEPGRFEVMVGPSSVTLPLLGHFDVV